MDPSLGPSEAWPNEDVLDDQQARLEQEATRLARRVHRLQAKQSQRHIARHVQAFVRHHQSVTGIGCALRREPASSTHSNGKINSSRKQQPSTTSNVASPASNLLGLSPAEEKMRILNQEGVKSMSTSELVNLVKQLEHNGFPSDPYRVPNSTSNTATVNNATANGDGSNDATSASSVYNKLRPPSETKNNSSLAKEVCETRKQLIISSTEADAAAVTAGQLKANLEHLEEDYDSDATESSSGGESCDDGLSILDETTSHHSSNNTNNAFSSKKSHGTQLKDNLSWRWAVERGAIASRWMWLLAQVHDLELKIRQQNEVYRSLRISKGSILFETRASDSQSQGSSTKTTKTTPTPTTCNTPSSSTLPSSLSSTTAANSSSSSLPATSTNSTSTSNEEVDCEPSSCVRTMPLRGLRRRKLVRASVALASATRKIARQTTVQCSCSSLPSIVSPCVLCNGRYSYVQVIDTNCMPQNERIAILDPSCHSVLSLPNQISLGLHFSKFLKKETIQKNLTSVKKKKSLSSPEKANNVTTNNKALNNSTASNTNKSSPSNIKKSQAVISSSKLKKKYEGHEKKRGRPPGTIKSKSRERHESSSNGSADSSRHGSPLPSPLPTAEPAPRRRRSDLQHAYDIDNIVIPYHMACAPRIEKPKYKEIITPKWREIDFETVKIELDEDMLEDLSDERCAERHQRCEMEEKKRFLTFIAPNATNPGSGGPKRAPKRGRVRCDSKNDPAANESASTCNGFDYQDCNSQDSIVSGSNGPDSKCIRANSNHSKTLDSSENIVGSRLLPRADSSESGSNNAGKGTNAGHVMHGQPARAFERRRTTSSSRTREDSIDEEHIPEVLPYERRVFPLSSHEEDGLDDSLTDTESLLNNNNNNNNTTTTTTNTTSSSSPSTTTPSSKTPTTPQDQGNSKDAKDPFVIYTLNRAESINGNPRFAHTT